MSWLLIRKRLWPRKVLSDLDVVLRGAAGFQDFLPEQVAKWDRLHDELTGDPLALSMTLDLAHMLPKWLGDEQQRILLAYETVFGSRSDSIAKALELACNATLNEQTRKRQAERRQDSAAKLKDEAIQRKLDREYEGKKGDSHGGD